MSETTGKRLQKLSRGIGFMALLLSFLAAGSLLCFAQSASGTDYTRICRISFDKDKRRPARVEDDALPCLLQAARALTAAGGARLYFVATADRTRDNDVAHGEEREEQDMTGEDLRYADVAAYRAVNTKAYMVQWLRADPKRIIPLTTYEDGQWLDIYLVPDAVNFKRSYAKATAPILSRPCTVAPCATGNEEFLLAQPRGQISK